MRGVTSHRLAMASPVPLVSHQHRLVTFLFQHPGQADHQQIDAGQEPGEPKR